MSFGPIELLVLRFPGNHFTGEIAPALKELVDANTIRVIDLLFATKDKDGNVTILEVNDLDDKDFDIFDPVVAEANGMLTEEDARAIAKAIPPNSSAGLLLFENVWATRFVDAVRAAKGEVVINERIPRKVIEQLVAAKA
jgi:uncharacterized membrane protein